MCVETGIFLANLFPLKFFAKFECYFKWLLVFLVQWLRVCDSIAGGEGFIPGWGRSPMPLAAAKKNNS